MWDRKKGPYRLVLNKKASASIAWHVKHYTSRKLMKNFKSGADLAKEMGVSPDVLKKTFETYNGIAEKKNDPWGKKFFDAVPFNLDDEYNVSIITPVLHYCMGGLHCTTDGQVVGDNGPMAGLYAAGEVVGGIHGEQRLGGSSLLDCVVFGRVAGRTVSSYLLSELIAAPGVSSGGGGGSATVHFEVAPSSAPVRIQVDVGGSSSAPQRHDGAVPKSQLQSQSQSQPQPQLSDPNEESLPKAHPSAPLSAGSKPDVSAAPPPGKKEYTMEEVAKHNTEKDCWVVVNGEVLDVTKFLPDHPGGKKAILIYAGKDATEEFNMLHEKNVVVKYAPDSILGTLKA
jgi:cytochrome b involved in lipid metabolism